MSLIILGIPLNTLDIWVVHVGRDSHISHEGRTYGLGIHRIIWLGNNVYIKIGDTVNLFFGEKTLLKYQQSFH
jgi:hypothetical protein